MASETASTHRSAAFSGTHSFTVSGHSTYRSSRRRCADRNSFTVGRYAWEVAYFPNGGKDSGRKYASAFLVLLNPRAREEVRASFTISLRDPAMSVEAAKTEFSHTFTRSAASAGKLQYVFKDELAASGCLHEDNDSLVVECAVEFVATRLTGDVIVPPSDLSRHIGGLLESHDGADTTVRVGDREFIAHRCVLAARSPVLAAQLYGPMKESGKNAFRIRDVDASVFKILRHFMYNDALPEFKDDDGGGMTKELLVAANLYGMEGLKLVCEERLSKGLDVSTVVGMLEFADEYYCGHLKACCIKYVLHCERMRAVVEREDFKDLTRRNPKIMEDILLMVADTLLA